MPGFFPLPPSLVEMEDTMKMSFDEEQGITGTRRAEVSTPELAKAIKAMLGTVFINPLTGQQTRYGADQWPGLPRLRAYHVETRPIGRTGNTPWDYGLFTSKTELTVQYRISPYGEPDDEDDEREHPEDQVFCEQEIDYHCEILTVPVKTTITTTEITASSSSSGGGSTTTTTDTVSKKNIRIPTMTYTLTIPKLLKPDYALMNDIQGKVNTVKIFGGAAGTVLFEGPKLSNTVMAFGDKAWKLVLKFIYNRHGWNNTLDPQTLTWVPAVSLDPNATPPYETADLRKLFKQIPK